MNSVHLTLTNDDLENAIGKIIRDAPNKKDLVKVLTEGISNNHVACSLLFKVILGGKLPVLPPVGTIGYIKPESLNYNQDKKLYEKVIQHGYIPCRVVGHRMITDYSPLVVELPEVGDTTRESMIMIEAFFPEDNVDIYDDLPI